MENEKEKYNGKTGASKLSALKSHKNRSLPDGRPGFTSADLLFS